MSIFGLIEYADASPEVNEVLALCEQMRLESHGAFDITAGALPNVPERPGLAPLDPSGLVKGWAVAKAGAFIFGSLASRSPYNLEQLDRLLGVRGPLKFFDVNLRPPFVDPKRIVELAARAVSYPLCLEAQLKGY